MTTAIRAISLWNPWALAMCKRKADGLPIKAVETRHWVIAGMGTDEQFPLAIHAAKKVWKRDGHDPKLIERVHELKLDYMMPYGAILGIVWVTGWRRVDDLIGNVSADDLLFGNYVNEDSEGNFQQRYGWMTDPEKLKILKTPYYCRGAQGIFTWVPPEGLEYR